MGMRYLIEELGADVNIQDAKGRAPLFAAALKGYIAVVRIMLKLGADINRRCDLNITPLMAASNNKHEEVVKWFVIHEQTHRRLS
jgi:ankyrin repeat protein